MRRACFLGLGLVLVACGLNATGEVAGGDASTGDATVAPPARDAGASEKHDASRLVDARGTTPDVRSTDDAADAAGDSGHEAGGPHDGGRDAGTSAKDAGHDAGVDTGPPCTLAGDQVNPDLPCCAGATDTYTCGGAQCCDCIVADAASTGGAGNCCYPGHASGGFCDCAPAGAQTNWTPSCCTLEVFAGTTTCCAPRGQCDNGNADNCCDKLGTTDGGACEVCK